MSDSPPISDVAYHFAVRRRPYPADLRADWRITAVLLAVDRSRGKRASVPQVHVLVWALLDAAHGASLARALSGADGLLPPVRFDPAVSLAVDRAIGFGLLRRDGKRVMLSAPGHLWLEAVHSDPELLSEEKEILQMLGGAVSMAAVDRIAGLPT